MSVHPEKTHWRDVLGNPYIQSPNAEMLTPEGFIKTGYRGLRGQSKEDTEKRFIHYDRDYVVSFIAKKIVIPLGLHTKEIKFNDLQALISEAIKLSKEQG